MRLLLITLAATSILAACSSTTTAPAASTASAPVATSTTKAPQCYNGDDGKFTEVGTTASISGVAVTCQLTADGKGAQWMGKKP